MLPLCVILGALLYAVAILHQPSYLPVTVRPYSFGKLGPDYYRRGSVTPCCP